MPIYTYACQSCSSTLERRQSFSDEPLTVHDECGGSLRRVIHPAGIVFKGSGFYNTDYKNSTSSNKSDATETKTDSKSSDSTTSETSSGAAASTNGTASSSGSDSSTSKTESKPAASATPAPTTP